MFVLLKVQFLQLSFRPAGVSLGGGGGGGARPPSPPPPGYAHVLELTASRELHMRPRKTPPAVITKVSTVLLKFGSKVQIHIIFS